MRLPPLVALAAAALGSAPLGAAELRLPQASAAAANVGVGYLKTLGYQGAMYSDGNRNNLFDRGEITLRDYQGGKADTVLYKELNNFFEGTEGLNVEGSLAFGNRMFVVVSNAKGRNVLEPKSGDLVFGTWFGGIGKPTAEIDGRFFATATDATGKAWIDLSAGGKYKGEYYKDAGPVRKSGDGFFYVATGATGQQNVVSLPEGEPVGKSWAPKVVDLAADGRKVYMRIVEGRDSTWVQAKSGKPVRVDEMTQTHGLYFVDGLGALWGRNARGEWGNVDIKSGKPLGKGWQEKPVGPLQSIEGRPVFKACAGRGCNYIEAKSGEDMLQKNYPDLSDFIWHFGNRDFAQAKDALGRYTYLDIQREEPLVQEWYTSLGEPSTQGGLFSFTATLPSGRNLVVEVTPEGLVSRKNAQETP